MSRKLNELFSNGMQIALEANTIRQIKKNIIAVNVNPEALSRHLLYKDYSDVLTKLNNNLLNRLKLKVKT